MIASIKLVRHMTKENLSERNEAPGEKRSSRFVLFQKLVIAVKQIDYIWDFTNWIELPLFVLASIFSIVVFIMWNDNFCLFDWQWQIGTIIIWLSWIEFTFLSVQFQLIGVYTLMFIRILKSLLRLLPFALLLVAAFSLTFHFLLYQPNIKVLLVANEMLFIVAIAVITLHRHLHISHRDIPF